MGQNEDLVGPIFQAGKKRQHSALFDSVAPKEPARQEPVLIQKRYRIGLDIGSSSIKAVQLGSGSDGNLHVMNMAFEKVSSPGQATDVLKKIAADMNIEGEVISSLSCNKAQIKRIELPMMPESEIGNALKWEMQQLGKENVNNLSLDYIVLPGAPEKNDKNKLKLLVVAVSKKDVFDHMSILKSAGLKAKAIEADPLAAYTALSHSGQFRLGDVVIFLDIGLDAASLNIIANGVRFSRSLYTTGNYLTNSISKMYSMDFNKAEELKISQGLSGDMGKGFASALEKIVLDIDHSFKYFSYSLSGSSVLKFDRIVLSGGTSNLKGITEFLGNQLKVPVEIANPFKNVIIDEEAARKMSNATLSSIAPYFCVALGLALREI